MAYATHKEWRQANPERWAAIVRRNALKRRYGITPEEYEDLLERQHGGCAVCGRECPSGRRLAVDHDHETGVVRGLLCSPCNTAIGQAGDDPQRLRALATYLEV